MSIILAIETSTELASVALLRNQEILVRESSGVQTHSQAVLPMVQDLLNETGVRVQDCDALAFGSGPGSFTGVRTACGVIQGLAFAGDLPVVPVVTLLAMAQACYERYGKNEVLTLLDARMEEVYWARYRYDQAWHIVDEPALAAAGSVPSAPAAAACGNGLEAYAAAFEEHVFGQRIADIPGPHARHVAQLAQQALARGETVAAREAQPLYLRNKVALTTLERQARLSV